MPGEHTATSRLQLAPGTCLAPDVDGTLLLWTPDDAFLRVHGSPETLSLFRAVAGGSLTPERALEQAPDPDELVDLLESCRREGLLTPHLEPAPLPSLRVGLLDTNPLAAATATVLESAGFMVASADEEPFSGDLVLSCAGYLPDDEWLALSDRCLQVGRAWHMVYAEGNRWYIGPLFVPGVTASYRDVRLRRLSAADRPAELLRCWQWLATEPPPPAWPDAAGCAILAGVIAQDILAWARGELVANVQHAVRLAPFALEAHPVLPLPFPPAGSAQGAAR
jgi:hypothetical protein